MKQKGRVRIPDGCFYAPDLRRWGLGSLLCFHPGRRSVRVSVNFSFPGELKNVSSDWSKFSVVQRGQKVTSLDAHSLCIRCAQHLHDMRATWSHLRIWCKYCVHLLRACTATKDRKLGVSLIPDDHGHIENTKKWYYSWTNGSIESTFLSWVDLVRMHDIMPGFLIWPTFQGHRSQSSIRVTKLACFLTAGDIDLKLYTYIPRRSYELPHQHLVRWFLAWPPWDQNQKHKICHS
jgi:hypothetical protein